MQRRASIVAIALLVGLGSWYWLKSVNADEPIEREYLISTDPITEVLKVRMMGGAIYPNLVRAYTVFADGRLLLELVSAVDSEVKSQHEMQLSDEELDFLVSTAVYSGLIEHDHALFRKEERSYINSHGGTMWFEMNIEQYRGPGQEDWGPASCSMVVRDPFNLSKRLPEVESLQALTTLGRKLYDYRKLTEQHDAN